MDERGIPTHVLLVDNLCLVIEGRQSGILAISLQRQQQRLPKWRY